MVWARLKRLACLTTLNRATSSSVAVCVVSPMIRRYYIYPWIL